MNIISTFEFVLFSLLASDSYIPNADIELKCNYAKVPVDGNGTVTCDVSLSLEKSLWGIFFWYKVNYEILFQC